MKRTFAYLTFLFVSIGVVAWARMGGGQIGMQLPFVLRQPSTPGTQESGNTNISGKMIAGLFQGSGANLTNVNAALLSGFDYTAFGRVASGNTWTGANTFSSGSNSFTGVGTGLTLLNASSLASGSVADARLTSNVALLNLAQTFSAAKTFSAAPSFTAAGTPFTVTGTNVVTNLNADFLDGLSSNAFGQLGAGNTWQKLNVFSSSISIPPGAGAGKVLTSDAGGFASWATGAPPSGNAGGDLTGTYPNPTLAPLASSLAKVSGGTMTTSGGTVNVPNPQGAGYALDITGSTSGTGLRSTSRVAMIALGSLSGVAANASDQIGRAVEGWAESTTGANFGGWFQSSSTQGTGVAGIVDATTGTAKAVYGNTKSSNGWAGYFDGRGYFSSTLGIGAVPGSGALQVAGQGATAAGWFDGGSGNGLYGVGGYAGIGCDSPYLGGIFFGGAYGVYGNGTGAGSVGVYGYCEADGSYGGYFAANGSNSLAAQFDGRSFFNGKVGIGTGQPAELLEIRGGGGPTSLTFQPGKHYASNQANKATIDIPGTGDLLLWDNVHVNNVFTAGTKNFLIDHPSDPYNKFLRHGCIESNEYKNLYDGTVATDDKGYARVIVPTWFTDLNENFRYQLTVVDDGDSADFVMAKISKRLTNGAFMIRTSKPNIEVCWQITGVRKDAFAKANPLVVEEAKPEYLRGKLIHPEAFGEKDWSPQPSKGEPKRPRLPSPPAGRGDDFVGERSSLTRRRT